MRTTGFARASSSAGNQVHFGATDEAGDEGVFRPFIERDRIGHLHDVALLHHADAVAHGHRFGLVVGHIDDRRGLALLAAGRGAGR